MVFFLFSSDINVSSQLNRSKNVGPFKNTFFHQNRLNESVCRKNSFLIVFRKKGEICSVKIKL